MKRLLPLLLLPATALATDAPFAYTGDFTVADHPTINGAVVATFTSSGTLTMSADKALVRLLVVGGGGGGGVGAGGGFVERRGAFAGDRLGGDGAVGGEVGAAQVGAAQVQADGAEPRGEERAALLRDLRHGRFERADVEVLRVRAVSAEAQRERPEPGAEFGDEAARAPFGVGADLFGDVHSFGGGTRPFPP